MRTGFLWAIGLVLASNTLAQAQQTSPAILKPAIPTVLPDAGKAPDLSKPNVVLPNGCGCDNCCERPLRVWVSAEYLLWWTKSGPLSTPLVTTGSLADIPPGEIGRA